MQTIKWPCICRDTDYARFKSGGGHSGTLPSGSTWLSFWRVLGLATGCRILPFIALCWAICLIPFKLGGSRFSARHRSRPSMAKALCVPVLDPKCRGHFA